MLKGIDLEYTCLLVLSMEPLLGDIIYSLEHVAWHKVRTVLIADFYATVAFVILFLFSSLNHNLFALSPI